MLPTLLNRDVDQELCDEVSSYASQIAKNEKNALVTHDALRFRVLNVNPEALDRFNPKTITGISRRAHQCLRQHCALALAQVA